MEILKAHDIQPTPQRLAVTEFALRARCHPSADEVWDTVRRDCPTLSRGTVYNTLNLLVEKGLLKTRLLREGLVVFDGDVTPHHHFIDDSTGRIHDIPWDAVRVSGAGALDGFEVLDYQVVMRGRRRGR